MSTADTLAGINAQLAKTVGFTTKIDTAVANVTKNLAKTKGGVSNLAGGTGATAFGGGGSGASRLGLANFSTPTSGGSGSGSSTTTTSSTSQSSAGPEQGGGAGNLMAGALGVIGGVATAGWNMTPGVRDYAAMQGSLFPVAFNMPGGYSNQAAKAAIRASIGQGASGPFDPTGASAMASNAGMSFNLAGVNGRTALGNSLGAAGFAFQMTGMNNQAAMAGQMSLFGGQSGISNKLARQGLFTIDMSTGKQKDMGQIVDDLWQRFFGSKDAKVTQEQFDGSLFYGFLGASLRDMFGSDPALYQQIVSFMRVKVRAGGRAGMLAGATTGKNSVTQVAKGLGMTEFNNPNISAGQANTARANTINSTLEAGMQGYNTATDAIVNVNEGMQALASTLPDVVNGLVTMKSWLDTFGSSSEGSGVMGMASSLLGLLPGMATGGGNSTGDNINARLSPGEFVVNARATQQHRSLLESLNASGQAFGSGFSSPTKFFDKGGLNDSSAAVSWAKNSTDGGSTFSGLCDHYVGLAYGLPHSGYDSAAAHWDATPESMRHPGDTHPAVGSLVFWNSSVGGGNGHTAIVTGYDSNGNALVSTTHTNGGKPTIMPLNSIMQSAYLGWAQPFFGGKTADVVAGTTPSPTDAAAAAAGATGGILSNLVAGSVDTPTGPDFGAAAGYRSLDPLIGGKSSANSTDASGTSGPSSAVGTLATPKGTLAGWLKAAGFQGEHLREAWAIAMRESSGHPSSHNTNAATGDDSYGLFQINMLGKLGPDRDAKFKRYVSGYRDRNSLFDPVVNARAAAYMSNKGSNWGSWHSAHWGKADYYYDQYAKSASHGIERTHAGLVNVHEGEMIMPATEAQEFRGMLQDMLSGGGAGRGRDINIVLKIDNASDEEARRFAKKVKKIWLEEERMDRLGSR